MVQKIQNKSIREMLFGMVFHRAKMPKMVPKTPGYLDP